MKSLGEMIKEARKSLRLKQWEVADELNVARTTISNWECGRSQPDLETLRKLSAVLQCNLLSAPTEIISVQEPSGRVIRLKLTESPVIEVVASENASIFSAGSVEIRVNGSDSHGNPVDFHVSASFCVENDDE